MLVGRVSGCGPAASAGRLVIGVAWPTIDRAIRGVVRPAGILIIAIAAGVQRTLEAAPTSRQVSDLHNGARLSLRTEDGVEHEPLFTVE